MISAEGKFGFCFGGIVSVVTGVFRVKSDEGVSDGDAEDAVGVMRDAV